MARYSIDVDDVLAEYRVARAEVAKKLGIPPMTQPLNVDPETVDALMMERRASNHAVIRDWITDHLEEFFAGLRCLLGDDDRRAIHRAQADGHELFFVSSRSYSGSERIGKTEQLRKITERWLSLEGLPADSAHVLLTPDKAEAIIVRGITYHLDDMLAHVTSIALRSRADVYLLRTVWNQNFVVLHPDQPDGMFKSSSDYGVDEVDSVAEYISLTVGRPNEAV